MKACIIKSAKLTRALVLRDTALTVVRRMGAWEAVGVAPRSLRCWRHKILVCSCERPSHFVPDPFSANTAGRRCVEVWLPDIV